ncbi:MAG TPA: cytochrome c [Candidatus Acidoferrales bacterium]|nr:cytochrome c [Candidatus Acidoferrales bacterium]
MKPLTIGILGFFLSAGLAVAGAPEGKELFASKCAKCHGPNGEGKAAIAKMFNVTMPALASKEVQDKADADLKKVVMAGKGKMKPIADVTEKQADDVVAFVRTLK